MSTQQTQETPKLSQTSGVSKKKQPAVKRRADKKRAERLRSGMHILPSLLLITQLMSHSAAHLANIANSIRNRTRKQSQRWLQHTYNNSDCTKDDKKAKADAVYWVAHEGHGPPQVTSPGAVRWLDRLGQERKEARLAAGVGEGEYVEDWFGDEAGGKGKEKAKEETEEARREEVDDEESDDGGVPVVAGRIFLSPEAEEEMDKIA